MPAGAYAETYEKTDNSILLVLMQLGNDYTQIYADWQSSSPDAVFQSEDHLRRAAEQELSSLRASHEELSIGVVSSEVVEIGVSSIGGKDSPYYILHLALEDNMDFYQRTDITACSDGAYYFYSSSWDAKSLDSYCLPVLESLQWK